MTAPLDWGADVADLLEALGDTVAAGTIRWSRRNVPPDGEIEARDELAHAVDMLADLEAMLCKTCRAEWKEHQS